MKAHHGCPVQATINVLRVDARYVSSEWILRFEFGRTATKVFPVRAAP